MPEACDGELPEELLFHSRRFLILSSGEEAAPALGGIHSAKVELAVKRGQGAPAALAFLK
jgi:hypothetical protein